MESNNNNIDLKDQNIQKPKTQFNEPQISVNIDIHQKRIVLQDSKDPKQYFITSFLIYCAQYYPKTKNLLKNTIQTLINNGKKQNFQLIFKCSHILSEDVLRQIVYGPSATYIPPSELPHLNRLDTGLMVNQTQKDEQFLKSVLLAHQQLNISDIIPKNKVKQLLWYSRSKSLRNSRIVNNRYHSKQLRNQLQVGGQNWLQVTPLAGLFLVLKQTWKIMLNGQQNSGQLFDIQQKIRLLLARFSFLHNKILSNPVKQLSQDVFTNYQTFIKNMCSQTSSSKGLSLSKYVQILIQYSYCLLFYYKYKKCQRLINKCCQILQMQIQYTGKLGRRTKYQSFDCAQLIMKLKRRTHQKIQQDQINSSQKAQQQQADKLLVPNAKILIVEQIYKSKKEENIPLDSDKIKQSVYDEDNILLEKPLLIEENQGNEVQKQNFVINKQKIITALATINYTNSTVPHDQMLFQYIAASLQTILTNSQSLNYALQFSVLLMRSFNDFPRVKHAQRALQQLQTLKIQYDQRQIKNTDLLFSSPYLTRFEFIMKFADRYMDIQMVLTGVDLLKKAGMYQECVDGLIQKNYKQKALQLVNQIIQQKGKTPRLLCMLGDIHHNQIKFYQEAWELSEKKYGRAMRSLGWVYFSKQNYQKAAECFTLATQVNYYNPNTWFTLGCCYIRMNQYEKALRPFGQSIRIDQTQGQAWGNMASCYMHLKKMKEAYSTLQQAVKHSQGNWKLWSNLLTVSLSLKQFYKFFQCIQKIVKLNHSQIITKDILNKIQMIMKFQISQTIQGKIRKRILFNFKRRIERLFQFLQQSIGQNPLIWQAKTSFLQTELIYLQQIYRIYYKLHKMNKVDPNDLIDGYQTPLSTNQTTQVDMSFCKQQIIRSKQNQLNMIMKIGWEQNKIQCQNVLKVLKQYIQIYNTYNVKREDDLASEKQFRLFINGLKDKLEKGLQRKVELETKNQIKQ